MKMCVTFAILQYNFGRQAWCFHLLIRQYGESLSRIQLAVVKSFGVNLCEQPPKRFFGGTFQCPGVCLKFPSQCRQASFPNSTGSLLQLIVNMDGMWIDVTIGEDYRVNLPTVCLFPDTVTRHRAVQMLNQLSLL